MLLIFSANIPGLLLKKIKKGVSIANAFQSILKSVENDFSFKNSKEKFLASKDQISNCQFKLSLGIAGWVFYFPYFYNSELLYCKICQIFYYSLCRNRKSLYKNMKYI